MAMISHTQHALYTRTRRRSRASSMPKTTSAASGASAGSQYPAASCSMTRGWPIPLSVLSYMLARIQKTRTPPRMSGYLAPLANVAMPALVWLERHVRRPLENSLPDRVLFSPAKAAYCRLRRQD